MAAYATSTRRPPRTLTELEQAQLLKVTGEHARGFRDHTILSIALGTGLRVSEIAALNVGDVADARGRVKRRIVLRTFKRRTENPAPQQILLPDGAYYKLGKFLCWKKARGESLEPDSPLLLSRNGRRLSTRGIRMNFRNWQRRAGFEDPFTFHQLRHTACTNLFRRTKDLKLVQKFSRHTSILSTQIYLHPTDQDLIEALRDQPC